MPAPAPPAPGLGTYLREARHRASMTSSQVADALGVHQTTVSGWELGRGWNSMPRYVSRLANIYEVDEDEIQRLWWSALGG
jgi:transcriptional regulator with XRE-family HTH domain